MSPIGKYEPILRIAELGSLTRAAESLGYSQSSLSHLTANLEKELGVRIRYSPLAQFMGALGAALYGWDQADKGQGSM